MNPEQQQTGAEAAQAQAPNTSGEPQFDPSFIPQMQSSDAMAGILPGQAFISNPMVADLSMGNPSMMLPMMLANGQVPQHVPEATSISADEIALYDRQIRLWGMAAQAKIQNANILLITMRALANEVAKNLVLAGIKSITILDSANVTEADLGAQFFQNDGDSSDTTQSHVGRNRAEAAAPALRKLNPRVQVHVDAEGVKTKGPSYFAAFDIVIATDLDPDSFNLINTATRINGKAFYAAGTHGMFGFIFSDLIEHDFVIERDAGNVATHAPQQETRTRSIVSVQTKQDGGKTVESVAKRELYSTWFLASDIATLPDEYASSKRRLRAVTPALSCLRALWEFVQVHPSGGLPATRDDLRLFTQLATQKHKALRLPSETLRPEFLRTFLQNLGAEVAPVAAVLGGQLAQDVINVLGQRQQPIQNTVIFDGHTMEALVYALHPEGILGADLLSSTAAAGIIPSALPVPIGVNGLPMMDDGVFPLNGGGGGGGGGGFPHNNGLGVPVLEPQPSLPQEGVQPAIPVQQPPMQQPVSAPEQPPQDPAAGGAS